MEVWQEGLVSSSVCLATNCDGFDDCNEFFTVQTAFGRFVEQQVIAPIVFLQDAPLVDVFVKGK
jgi:hypothetical protein